MGECERGIVCEHQKVCYSQCVVADESATSTSRIPEYFQCGCFGWMGPVECMEVTVCKHENLSYSVWVGCGGVLKKPGSIAD